MNRPKVHFWTVVYFFVSSAPFLFLCLWAIKDGWFPSERVLMKHSEMDDYFYLFNQTLAYFTGAATVLVSMPAWIVIFGKRKPWVWTIMFVCIILGILNNPLMGIPVLIFWIKDGNKEYYGKPIT